MARKNYSDEFKGDAVALYRDTEGATITAIAGDLGVSDAVGMVQGRWCTDPSR
jgi:transposase